MQTHEHGQKQAAAQKENRSKGRMGNFICMRGVSTVALRLLITLYATGCECECVCVTLKRASMVCVRYGFAANGDSQ